MNEHDLLERRWSYPGKTLEELVEERKWLKELLANAEDPDLKQAVRNNISAVNGAVGGVNGVVDNVEKLLKQLGRTPN